MDKKYYDDLNLQEEKFLRNLRIFSDIMIIIAIAAFIFLPAGLSAFCSFACACLCIGTFVVHALVNYEYFTNRLHLVFIWLINSIIWSVMTGYSIMEMMSDVKVN